MDVLKNMESVEPFPTVAVSEASEKDDEEQKPKTQRKGKKVKKQNKGVQVKKNQCSKQKTASRSKKSAMPPSEEAVNSAVQKIVATLSVPEAYEAKAFGQLRRDFIAALKKELPCIGGQVANEQWMLSNVRSDVLSTLDEPTLKKRRFM